MNESIITTTEIDPNEQKLREDLIQRATTRLRQRLLEQELEQVLHKVVSLQSELESLRLDVTVTLDTVSTIDENTTSTQKLLTLERRLDAHKSTLVGLKDQTIIEKPTEANNTTKEDDISPYSMSRLSSLSLMSSLFTRSSSNSSRATSIIMSGDEKPLYHNEEDHPFYDLAGKRSFGAGSFCGSVYGDDSINSHVPMLSSNSSEIRYKKRRQRRQHYQQQCFYHENNEEDSMSDYSSSSCSSSVSNVMLDCPLTPTTPPPCYYNDFNQSYHQPWINEDDPLDSKMSLYKANYTDCYYGLYPQRNILDEAMSFLDGLSENGDDGGFGEDMYFLLQNPDLCCKPFSEIMDTLSRQHQQQEIMLKDVIHLLKPTTWIQLGLKYSGAMLYDVTCTSLEWCRFLSILSAAVIISLMKGPEDMKKYTITS